LQSDDAPTSPAGRRKAAGCDDDDDDEDSGLSGMLFVIMGCPTQPAKVSLSSSQPLGFRALKG